MFSQGTGQTNAVDWLSNECTSTMSRLLGSVKHEQQQIRIKQHVASPAQGKIQGVGNVGAFGSKPVKSQGARGLGKQRGPGRSCSSSAGGKIEVGKKAGIFEGIQRKGSVKKVQDGGEGCEDLVTSQGYPGVTEAQGNEVLMAKGKEDTLIHAEVDSGVELDSVGEIDLAKRVVGTSANVGEAGQSVDAGMELKSDTPRSLAAENAGSHLCVELVNVQTFLVEQEDESKVMPTIKGKSVKGTKPQVTAEMVAECHSKPPQVVAEYHSKPRPTTGENVGGQLRVAQFDVEKLLVEKEEDQEQDEVGTSNAATTETSLLHTSDVAGELPSASIAERQPTNQVVIKPSENQQDTMGEANDTSNRPASSGSAESGIRAPNRVIVQPLNSTALVPSSRTDGASASSSARPNSQQREVSTTQSLDAQIATWACSINEGAGRPQQPSDSLVKAASTHDSTQPNITAAAQLSKLEQSLKNLPSVKHGVRCSPDMSISHPKTRVAVAEAGSLTHRIAYIQKDLEVKRAGASTNPSDRASDLLQAARVKARNELDHTYM